MKTAIQALHQVASYVTRSITEEKEKGHSNVHFSQHVQDDLWLVLYWKGILSWSHFEVQGSDTPQEKEYDKLIKLSYIVQVTVDQCLLKLPFI